MPRITDSSALTTGLVWVLLRYADNSEFCFQTTLNLTMLRERGIVLEEGKLVRLDKQYLENGAMVYRQFDFSGATVSLWSEMTYTDETSASFREFL